MTNLSTCWQICQKINNACHLFYKFCQTIDKVCKTNWQICQFVFYKLSKFRQFVKFLTNCQTFWQIVKLFDNLSKFWLSVKFWKNCRNFDKSANILKNSHKTILERRRLKQELFPSAVLCHLRVVLLARPGEGGAFFNRFLRLHQVYKIYKNIQK